LPSGIGAEVERLPHAAHGTALFVTNDTQHVERALLRRVAEPCAGDGHRQRNVVPIVGQPEKSRRDDDRQIGRRHRRAELLFELPLAILTAGVREVALGVITGPMLDPKIGTLDAHRDPSEAAVLHGVRTAVAKQVIRRGVALNLCERRTEVVGVDERPAASVGGERLQRIL
jgi:hypothetical protein